MTTYVYDGKAVVADRMVVRSLQGVKHLDGSAQSHLVMTEEPEETVFRKLCRFYNKARRLT